MDSFEPEKLSLLRIEQILKEDSDAAHPLTQEQIIDWFGPAARVSESETEGKIKVSIKTSPNAMAHWATRYPDYVEVLSPAFLREQIRNSLRKGAEKYGVGDGP